MPDVVCMGEVLTQFNAVTRGPLKSVRLFEMHAAGAEGNVAIGVSRLGVSSGIISHVGDDEFGHFLISSLKGENVDTTHLTLDKERQTGIFFVQRGYPIPDRSGSVYYRKDSAGSKISREDVDQGYLATAKIFHTTGITPALSKETSEAVSFAIKTAKSLGVSVSLDTNLRLKLWTEEDARSTLLPMCTSSDYLFTSPSDAKIILGIDQPAEVARLLHERGVSTVIVKLGDKGAFASYNGETATQPIIPSHVEDPTGAGDSFAATFLAARLRNWSLKESLRAAASAAALVVSVRGDYENIPNLEALRTLLDYEKGNLGYLR